MTSSNPESIIQGFLTRVDQELADLSESERTEILDDLRAHIYEAAGDPSTSTEPEVHNVLERLGDPRDVAREARDRSPDYEPEPQPLPPVRYDHEKTPGALEVAAIILTALFWPIGVLLAWVSERWKTRDKVIATVIPFVSTLMLGAIILGGLVAWGATGTSSGAAVVEQDVPAAPADPTEPDERSPQQISEPGSDGMSGFARMLVVIGFLAGIVAGPFISAVFLAIRLQPARQAQPSDYHRGDQGVPVGGRA